MDCQRRSGSAFGLSAFILEDQLGITYGRPSRCVLTGTSGKRKESHHCGRCGTMIYGRAADGGRLLWLRPGTLDTPHGLKIGAHIWVRSRQPWLVLAGDVPVFEEGYAFDAVWPQESLRCLSAASTGAAPDRPDPG